MILETLVVGALQVNCYVLGSDDTRLAVVIDPGDNLRGIQSLPAAPQLVGGSHHRHARAL
jgi:hypothetical protein